MKRIFFWLLKRYSSTEEERLEILSTLQESVTNSYREQTVFGNVYNANIEFIISNKFIKKLVKNNDTISISMVKSGLSNSFDESIEFIKNEK